jgi:branched-chain amino acid aminotransferase
MALERKGVLWCDGEIVPFEQATTHVLSHALHYGSGVFEGIRAYLQEDGSVAIFRLREHAERLLASARAYRMPMRWTAEQIGEACRAVVRENRLQDCYIRPLAFLGLGNLGVNPRDSATRTVVAAFPWGAYLGPEAAEKGVRATISSWTRLHHTMVPTAAKACGHYLNSLLATREAKEKGFDEAILLDRNGAVAEGAGENVFAVTRGTLRTPGADASILPGITRDAAIRIARDMGIAFAEGTLTRGDLLSADEVFFTGTAAEIVPVREIDGHAIGTARRGPVTERIQSCFLRAVRGGEPKYREWVTTV